MTGNELFWEWVGLIALAIVGVVILFVSSEQLRRVKRLYESVLEKEKQIEESQSKFLDDLGENIYDTAKSATKHTHGIIEKAKEIVPESEIKKVKEGEEKLLNTTQELIFYLKLKSKRVDIVYEDFNIYELMEEVLKTVVSKHTRESASFDVKIEESVPDTISGDSLHIGQVLINLLEIFLENNEHAAIRVHIHFDENLHDDGAEGSIPLLVDIADDNDTTAHAEILKTMEPYYDDERKEYVGIRLFVAQKLTELLGGRIEKNEDGTGVRVLILVPTEDGLYGSLPEECAEPRKTLIVLDDVKMTAALEEAFGRYGYQVKSFDGKLCDETIPNFSAYDLVLVEPSSLNSVMLEYLRGLLEQKRFDLVALERKDPVQSTEEEKGVHEHAREISADHELPLPFRQKNIYDLILKLCGYDKRSKESAPKADGFVPSPKEKSVEHEHEPASVQERTEKASEPETKGEEAAGAAHGTRTTPKERPTTAQEFFGSPVEKPHVTRESFGRFSGARILFADNNLINQKMMLSLLGRSGIDLYLANDGEEMLEELARSSSAYDLIVIDVHLPDMTGKTAAHKIRSQERYRHTPLVAFTGDYSPAAVEQYRMAGFNAILRKPIKIGNLYALFERLIGKETPQVVASSSTNASNRLRGSNDAVLNLPRNKGEVLDVQGGVEFSNGNEELYTELLKEFLAVYGESDQLLKTYMREDRLYQAKALMLDIKSIAATIGARSFYRMANELHEKLSVDHPMIDYKDLAGFRFELDALKSEIRKYLLHHS